MRAPLKIIIFSCIAVLFLLKPIEALHAQSLDVKTVSFNLWWGNNWDSQRKYNAANLINGESADIVGLQEADEAKERNDLIALCPGYKMEVGTFTNKGESTPIMYKNTVTLIERGTFGFSSQPDNPNVSDWGDGATNNWLRVCNWALFEKNGKRFYVFNNHMDANGFSSDPQYWRLKEAKLLCQRIAARKYPEYPFIVIGDLNGVESEPATVYYKSGSDNPVKMVDTYRVINPTGSANTFGDVKYDYILVENTSEVQTLGAKILYHSAYGWTSDHYQINATIRFNYNSTPVTTPVPGKVEAENYSAMNGVQTETTTDAGGGSNVGWIDTGDWMEYFINVTNAGSYDLAFRTAGLSAGTIRVEIDGIDATGSVSLPATEGWQTWITTTKSNVTLSVGQHTMRLFAVTGGFNLNYVTVSVPPVAQSPYNNTIVSLPGKIEAENYDLGGQGVAYNDVTTANEGAAYRTDGVDVQVCTDAGGGHNVGWTADGEWLEYTVNVASSGTYDVNFRTASTSGGAIRMEVDGSDVTGPVALPNTTGWQIWSTTTKTNVALAAGQHIVRLVVLTGGFNLNSVTVSPVSNGPGFLHASGKNIVNKQGNYILKTLNLGNFMVQEGYMLNLGGQYQHVIKQKIADVVGVANRDQFYDNYYNNFITKADIDSIAKWGFNSIRLPMHYNLFTPLDQPDVYIEKGFALVDNLLGWCKANNLYLILDLHAAPGGQSSGDISDYVAGQPSLWESAANREKTVKLWRKFAERYVNEEYIGGYDVINETNWTLANNNALLAQIMKDITAAIRQVDNNHLIFIEGNSYANDYNGLTPKWDNNMAYSFHKYWNDNVDGSLNFILSIRDAQNVPIWLGEFGENSNHWVAEAVSLMNKHNIGWAIWPYKKMESVSGLSSHKQPDNWSALANYINGGAKPTAAVGQAILNEWLENIKVQNCTLNKGYLHALLTQPGNNNTVPFTNAVLPGKISASQYDEGKNGYAYSDVIFQTAQFGAGGGSYTAWNTGWHSRNDGVDLQFSTAENATIVGWIENNEWMQYTVNVSEAGSYAVTVRAAGNGGNISLSSNGTTLLNNVAVAGTGGWDTWQTVTLGNISLAAGTNILRLTINTAGLNIHYLDFAKSAINQAPVVSITSPETNTSFTAPASITITAAATDTDGSISKVDFYNGTTLLGSDNTSPYSFAWSNLAPGSYNLIAKARDNLGAETSSSTVIVTVLSSITIQAEAYSSMSGVSTENTSDVSGVLNVGYIDAGDWMAYNTVNFPTSGNYTVEYRVASLSGGRLSCDLNAGSIQLGAVNVPATGGWQTWTTISQTITVNAGTYSFGIFAPTGGWNINWFRITEQSAASARASQFNLPADNLMETSFEFYPNPAEAELYIKSSQDLSGSYAKVFDAMGIEVISVLVSSEAIDVSSLKSGIYTLVISNYGNKVSRRFMKQ